MKRLMVAALCALGLSSAACAQRLPTNVIPESYDLTFTPNLEKATFSGQETIHVRLLKPAKTITLNSAEIEFQEVKITSGSLHLTTPVTTDEKSDQVTFTVPVELPPVRGRAELAVGEQAVLGGDGDDVARLRRGRVVPGRGRRPCGDSAALPLLAGHRRPPGAHGETLNELLARPAPPDQSSNPAATCQR